MKKIIGFLLMAITLTAISCNNNSKDEKVKDTGGNDTKKEKGVIEIPVPPPPPPPPPPKIIIKDLPVPPLPPPPPKPKKKKG